MVRALLSANPAMAPAISADSLSSNWARFQGTEYFYKGALTITRKANAEGLGLPFAGRAQFDGDGRPVLPMKDGSLIILKADAPDPIWKNAAGLFFGGVLISANGTGSIYFVAIDKLGLVHLQGPCSVKRNDGTTLSVN